MSTDDRPAGSPEGLSRADRSEKRRRGTTKVRGAALRAAKPSPLPPHPEGLKPSIWPPLALLAAIALAGWSPLAAFVAVGVVLAYAAATRNNRRQHLLYAYIQGHRQFRGGDYEAALANFEDMENGGFSPPAVVRAIGLTNYNLGRWAEAASYLEDVPDRTPEESGALGHALLELGELPQAIEVLDGIEDPPPVVRVTRAVADLKAGRPRDAARKLEAVLDQAGGGQAPAAEPYLGARYWLGTVLRDLGEEERGTRLLGELYDLDPSYHDVAVILGRPLPARETEEGDGSS